MIGRIHRALLAELVKLRHRRLVWVAFLAALVLGVGGTAGWERLSRAALELREGKAGQAINGFFVYADALRNGVAIGAIFLVIVAGLLMAEEHELGTAKILFSKPIRRTEIVTGKALALVATALALVALVAAGAALAGSAFGFGDIRDPTFGSIVPGRDAAHMARHAAIATALTVPPLVCILLLAFMVSALSEQSGIAVGMSFGLLLGASAASWLFDRAAPFLVTSYATFPSDTLSQLAQGISMAAWGEKWRGNGAMIVPLGLVVCAATGACAFAVAAIAVARRPILAALIACGCLLGTGRAAMAAEHKIDFQIQDVTVPGQVEDARTVDVDGDGKDDLVVFYTRGAKGPDPRRYLGIFYQRQKSGSAPVFSGAPDDRVEVPPNAVVRFVADVDPRSGGRELGFMGPEGVMCFAAKNRVFSAAPIWLVRDDGLFDLAAGNQLPSWDSLVKDVTGDGRADIIFPRKGTASVWEQVAVPGADGVLFRRAGLVTLDYKQKFGPPVEQLLLGRFLSFYGTLAKPTLVDVDGDGRADLVTMHERSIDTYLCKPGATRFSEPPDRGATLRVIGDDASKDDEEYNSVRTAVIDVDKDGIADLLVYRNVGKVSLFESMRTQILFYRGTAGGWKEAEPTQILNLKGISIDPTVVDVDNDGAGDLIVSSLRTDLVTNALKAIFSSVTVSYSVFRFDKSEKKFHDTADWTRDFNVDVSRLEGSGTIPTAYFRGDFDGDKTTDLLSLEDEKALLFFPGEATSGFFSGDKLDFLEGEKTRVEVETSNSLEIRDVNGDGKADVIMWYYPKNAEHGERGLVKLLLSK